MTIALPSDDQIADAPKTHDFSRRISDLGDGFRRTAKSGINNVRDKYTITWITMPSAEAEILEAILLGTGGVETITWTPIDQVVEKNFYLGSVSKARVGTINARVTATLIEKFI